jgi:hypothetical protein
MFSSLFDDPDYQQLSPDARLVLLTLRLSAQAGAAAIFRAYPAVVAEQTGLDTAAVEKALDELAGSPSPGRPWIYREGGIVWVRNALRYDPNLRLADPKHRKSIERAVQALPRLGIVARFCRYYEIASPFDEADESLHGPSGDLSSPSTETEVLPEILPETENRVSPNGHHPPQIPSVRETELP